MVRAVLAECDQMPNLNVAWWAKCKDSHTSARGAGYYAGSRFGKGQGSSRQGQSIPSAFRMRYDIVLWQRTPVSCHI
jgi:hypothetical protein